MEATGRKQMKWDDDYPHEEEAAITLKGAVVFLVVTLIVIGLVAWFSSAPQIDVVLPVVN